MSFVPLRSRITKQRRTPLGAVFETTHRAGSFLRAHRHDAPYVSIVLDGEYTEVSGDVPVACPSGAVIVHGPGEEHADYFRRDARCLNVEVPEGLLQSAPRRLWGLEASLHRGVEATIGCFYGGTASEALEAAVSALASSIERRARPRALPLPRWLDAALASFDWIEPVPLRGAAQLSGVHQTHFSRAFRQYLGLTPSAYRREARIHNASKLLLRTSLSTVAIAVRCGFADQSHFTRAFRDGAGVAPATYRRIFAR